MLERLGSEFQIWFRVFFPEAVSMRGISQNPWARGIPVKKGIVAVLVVIALIVLISPGIVGKLAERSVDEQLKWAADENQEVVVKSERFDRGWFSSEGRHRIELGRTGPGAHVREALGLPEDAETPALVIDTRLDHGLIPVSSVTRAEGSLAPGLGRAMSTVSIEYPDGSVTKIPGVIYSEVGLGGGLTSNYFLESGSSGDTTWGAGDIKVKADARNGRVVADGGIDSLTFLSEGGSSFTLGTMDMSADLTMSDYGYSVGDMDFTVDAITIVSPVESGAPNVNMGPIKVSAVSALDDDRLDTAMNMDFAMADMAPIGDVAWSIDLKLNDLDAAAAGRVQRSIEGVGDTDDPTALFAAVENDLMDLMAAGLEARFDRFDVTLPAGTMSTKLAFTLPETDRQSFSWSGVLLDLVASAELKIPEALFDFITTMNPQVGAAVAMGFLKKNGDVYEMAAEYKQGLLTVNGAPMPIPIPGG